jgi:predicted transposase YbfD/YdcC
MKNKGVKEYFECIEDKRNNKNKLHNMLEIIIMTICAVVAGCDDWDEIAVFCKAKEAWFRRFLVLENGVASHDTFNRVISMIDPKQFEKCFIEWVSSVNEITKGQVVAIDGKTVRRSGSTNKKAVHMVSAWANDNKLVLGQIKTEEKSNEITAIPELLDLLDVSGCIVTIDAMGCQRDIAEKIIDKQADYVLAVKANQGRLLEDIKLFFETEKATSNYFVKREKSHGRLEKREYYITSEIEWLETKNNWRNIKSIGMTENKVTVGDITTTETRYFITSLGDNAEIFGKAVRDHWGIENSLHWVLDMAFREDESRARKDNSAENFSVIRRIALNLIRKEGSKGSLKIRRKRCSFDDNFLYKVVFDTIL